MIAPFRGRRAARASCQDGYAILCVAGHAATEMQRYVAGDGNKSLIPPAKLSEGVLSLYFSFVKQDVDFHHETLPLPGCYMSFASKSSIATE